MVYEFADVQGVMGREYARKAGEPEEEMPSLEEMASLEPAAELEAEAQDLTGFENLSGLGWLAEDVITLRGIRLPQNLLRPAPGRNLAGRLLRQDRIAAADRPLCQCPASGFEQTGQPR